MKRGRPVRKDPRRITTFVMTHEADIALAAIRGEAVRMDLDCYKTMSDIINNSITDLAKRLCPNCENTVKI